MNGDAPPPPQPGPRLRARDDRAEDILPFRLGRAGWLLLAVLGGIVWAGSGGGSRTVESRHLKRTRVMARTLAHALERYAARYPERLESLRPRNLAEEGTIRTDTGPQSGLVAKLAGADTEPGLDFLYGYKEAVHAPADSKGPADWRNGITRAPGEYAIHDPYGGVFHVLIDVDGDGSVENPNPDERAEGITRLPGRAAVWTYGKDQKEETWEDNAMSWR